MSELTLGPPASARALALARRRRALVMSGVALLGWVGLIAVAHYWGEQLNDVRDIALDAPPLYGQWDWRLGSGILPAVAVAVLVVAFGPWLATRVSFRVLVFAAPLVAAGWAVALAGADGLGAITDPLESNAGYLRNVDDVKTPGDFLSHFTERIDGYAVHVRSHPPGMVLLLWALAQVGLGGAGVAAALVIAGGAATVPAALLTVREVAGDRRARAAAPYLALAPAALWIATTADALFAGVAAWAVALVVLATGRTGARGDATALGGGLMFGLAAFLTYGVVPLAAVPLAVAVARRRVRPLLLAALSAGAVVAAFAVAGFWWVDGLDATREQYRESIALARPYDYFLLANLAAFALAVGPAAVAGLATLHDRGMWLLAGGTLAAVAAADVSGLSKAEVERIWLLFVPWTLVATAALPGRPVARRSWLALQGLTALGVQVGVRMPW